MTTTYYSTKEMADKIGIPLDTLRRRAVRQECPVPDVRIGAEPRQASGDRYVLGWSHARVIAFGQLCKTVDADGRTIPYAQPRRIAESAYPDWWWVTTAVYLSSTDITLLWGRTYNAVQVRRTRGSMCPPDVHVGPQGRAGSPGWSLDTIREYSAREGIQMADTWEIARHARLYRTSIEEATVALTPGGVV